MLRCAASIVIAAYVKIRLIPLYLRALPLGILQSSRDFCLTVLMIEILRTCLGFNVSQFIFVQIIFAAAGF